jgi:hypothetical protein
MVTWLAKATVQERVFVGGGPPGSNARAAELTRRKRRSFSRIIEGGKSGGRDKSAAIIPQMQNPFFRLVSLRQTDSARRE